MKVNFCHLSNGFLITTTACPNLAPTRCVEPQPITPNSPGCKLSGTDESCNVTQPWGRSPWIQTRQRVAGPSSLPLAAASNASAGFPEGGCTPHRRPASSSLQRPSLTAGRQQETQKDAKAPEETPGEGHSSSPPPKRGSSCAAVTTTTTTTLSAVSPCVGVLQRGVPFARQRAPPVGCATPEKGGSFLSLRPHGFLLRFRFPF